MTDYTGPQAYPLLCAYHVLGSGELRIEYVIAWRDGAPVTTSGQVAADFVGYGVTRDEAAQHLER